MPLPIAPVTVNVDLNTLIDQAVKLAKGLRDHLGSLVSMPALARQRLDEVLVEIDKTFTAVDKVVEEHLKVALDPSRIETEPDRMIHLAGPALPMRIQQDRGHCSAIGEIYRKYLRGVLDPLLAANMQAKAAVDQILSNLSSADSALFDRFADVGAMLQERAKHALSLQLGNDVAGAKALLKRDAANLIDMRQRLQDAHLTLVGIRNDFIKGMAPPP